MKILIALAVVSLWAWLWYELKNAPHNDIEE